MANFEGVKGGVPFPRSEKEWIDKGRSPEEARQKMRDDVFGAGHQVNAKGEPIECGKGSALQPTAQHQQALMIAQDAERARQMRMGWHPGMTTAFDPKIQDQIDQAVKAALAGAKHPRKAKKAAKKPAPSGFEGTA